MVGANASKDTLTGKMAKALKEFGLVEAIRTKHKTKSLPATQNGNQQRTPIDGLWTSQSLEIKAAGYLGFGEGGTYV